MIKVAFQKHFAMFLYVRGYLCGQSAVEVIPRGFAGEARKIK